LLVEARKREEELEKEKNKEENEDCFDRLKGKRAEGYLEIFMSFVHNFFDGFAIGVGFGTRDSN
jgi:zinc transporter ZupT